MAERAAAIDRAESAPSPIRALLGNVRVVIGGTVVLLLLVVALLADLLAPADPLRQDLLFFYLPPFWMEGAEPGFWLGTDSLGRDILSRLIHAARIAVTVAVIAASATAVIGTTLGLLAGFYGRWIDTIVSRLIDIWMAFPPVLLSIVLVAVLGAGLHSVIIAIAVIDWTRFARVVRAEVMVQREQDYIASAMVIGLSRWRTLTGEILPNVLPLLLTLFTLEMGIAIIVEAILSFVGLSLASDFPTWGGMIAEGRQVINQAWWLMAFPVAVLIVVVIALNMLGDGLRQALDPVLRR
ncbi:MAG: ABC transporter permease [Azospirillaceae bacterium]